MWNDLAATFGLQLVELSDVDTRLRIGDHDLTDDERKQVHDELLAVIDTIGQDAKNIDPVNPWLSPGATDFDTKSVAARLDELLGPAGSLTRSVLDFQLGNDNCAPPTQQSYLGLLALVSAGRVDDADETTSLRGYWHYTETHRCGGGNDQLATNLAASIAADNLILGDPVTGIEVLEDRINFTNASGGRGRCDYLVLAVPPTAWPSISSHLDWDPAQHTMSHGPAVKYLNSFATAFWTDSGLTPNALWDGIGSVWEGTDAQAVTPGVEYGLSVYSGGTFVLDQSSYPTKLAAIFPGYAPVAERFVDWPNTPGILTGYSVPAPGEVTTIGQALAEPHGRLYLAGEQTWVPFFGYMEGALQSGARAARDIIRLECPEAMP
jgi:monoamine oxidase